VQNDEQYFVVEDEITVSASKTWQGNKGGANENTLAASGCYATAYRHFAHKRDATA
jgi:hypothetical protein